MNLLGAKLYDPAGAVSKATSSLLAMTAFDTTNLRISFTVPAHGMVRVRIQCNLSGATTMPQVLLGVLEGSTVRGRQVALAALPGTALATTNVPLVADFVVSGLSPGAVNWDAAYGVETVVASTNIHYGGPNNTSANDAWGGFAFEVWDPQPITSGNQLSVDANGRVDVIKVAGTTQTAGDIIGDTNDIQARLPAALTADGLMKSDTLRVGGTLQTAGDLAAMITAVDDFVDTEVSAIKTKTDFLPSATAGAAGGLLIAGVNASFTCTGEFLISNGLVINASTANKSAVKATGNGTGHGMELISGSGATGDGLKTSSNATNGHGIESVGKGSGHGALLTSGASGNAIKASGARGLGIYGTTYEGIYVRSSTADAIFLGASSGNGIGMNIGNNGFEITAGDAGVVINANNEGIQIISQYASCLALDCTYDHAVEVFTSGASKDVVHLEGLGTNNNGIKIVATGTGKDILLAGSGNIDGDLLGTIDGLTPAALKDFFDTDSGTTAGAAVAGSVVKEIVDNAGGASLTVQDIVDGVWDEPAASHVTAGTTGKALSDINSNAAAIKAKTDNLPSDPADASDIASSFTAVNTKLDTIDDFLDTEIAAIKAKTDNLPSDPADASDIASSFTTVNTKLDTIDDFLDTEIAAIKAKTDNLPASPAATGDIPTANQNADALLGRNIAGGSSTGRLVKDALRFLRNKWAIATGTLTVYEEDDTTPAWTATVATDASADPITGNDPS